MPEETVMDSTATDTTATDAGLQTDSYINTDGSFKEGWRDHLIPSEVHTRNTMLWSGMNSVNDLINQINNQDLRISREGKGIALPRENATDSEIEAFHKAIGCPDSPDGYTLNIPEDVKQYYQDQELMAEAKREMHKLGLTPKQFAGVMALDAMRMKKSAEAMRSDPMSFYEEALDAAMPVMKAAAETELRQKWGDAFDARLKMANTVITENTKEGDERNRILERIGNDPLIADLLATIQNKYFSESHGVDTSLGNGSFAKNLEQRIEEISKQLTPELRQRDRTRYETLLIEKQKLYSQRYPEK